MTGSWRASVPTRTPPLSTTSPCRIFLRWWIRPRRNSPIMKPSNIDDGSSGKMDEGVEQRRRRQVKVLLADDHTMFREGMAGMLTSSYGDHVQIVGKTTTGEEAVAVAREEDPDVIIMQVDRTLKKAKDTLRQMREGCSSPPKVIILTMFEDPRMVQQIMELGANAYIHKSATVEELFAAVRTAVDTSEGHVLVAMPQGALELSEDGKV